MAKVRFADVEDVDSNNTNLVADYAANKGFPDLGDYFGSLTLGQLGHMTDEDLIKGVATKHKIQMKGFVHHHLMAYLSS